MELLGQEVVEGCMSWEREWHHLKAKKVMLTPYSQVLCKVMSFMSLSVQYRQAPNKPGCYYFGVFVINFGDGSFCKWDS